MAQRNDQVFQLSLTEIAFTIAFILLLLLGYLVFKEQTARIAAQAELAKVQSSERATAALNTAKADMAIALRDAGAGSPDVIITKLLAAEDARAERDRLKKLVEDLDAKLTALTELQSQIHKAAQVNEPDVTKDEVASALALQAQVRKAVEESRVSDFLLPQGGALSPPGGSASAAIASSRQSKEQRNKEAAERVKQAMLASEALKKQLKAQLNRELMPGREEEIVQELVSVTKNFSALARIGGSPEQFKKENLDLRGQVNFLKNKLNARGGLDFPPCWADENGKAEFLFSIEVKPDSVLVMKDWPQNREADARALPGLSEVLAESPHPNATFASRILGIFNWSKNRDPQCRHYVHLKSSISDAVQSDRARLMIENYFYKVEIRR